MSREFKGTGTKWKFQFRKPPLSFFPYGIGKYVQMTILKLQ
ncbi:hypothetical protein PL373_18950 [Tenacibaculum maritimum]|nr:hypothetical protein [Tenacibaculum maritimum]MDB0603167.1 hypothetical protein [Tenacibaculum maritimum]MDB0610430.1 hypothetical protein [Tenacibaculum maritimum]